MKKNDLITIGVLIIITLLLALTSNNNTGSQYVIYVILALSCAKFLLVAFNFMELKKSNIFWKISVVSFLFLFMITILVLA